MNPKTIAFSGIVFLGGCVITTEKPANNATQPAPAPTTQQPAATAPATTSTAPEPRRPPTLRTGPAPAVRDQQAAEGAGGASGADPAGTGGDATQTQQ